MNINKAFKKLNKIYEDLENGSDFSLDVIDYTTSNRNSDLWYVNVDVTSEKIEPKDFDLTIVCEVECDENSFEIDVEPDGVPTFVPYGEQSVLYDTGKGEVTGVTGGEANGGKDETDCEFFMFPYHQDPTTKKYIYGKDEEIDFAKFCELAEVDQETGRKIVKEAIEVAESYVLDCVKTEIEENPEDYIKEHTPYDYDYNEALEEDFPNTTLPDNFELTKELILEDESADISLIDGELYLSIYLDDADDDWHDFCIGGVSFWWEPGYPDTWEEPGEPAGLAFDFGDITLTEDDTPIKVSEEAKALITDMISDRWDKLSTQFVAGHYWEEEY